MRLGIKVHWRDVDAMVAIAERHGATVLEYQMLPGDLEGAREKAFGALLPYRGRFELRVHQPEVFLEAGRQVFLDPASPDERVRARSAEVLGEVARFAMELRAKALIVHPGTRTPPGEPEGTPDLLRESLADVPRHVKLLLENMPYWHDTRALSGILPGESALFTRTAEGLAAFDDLVDGYVLDVSHAYLGFPGGSRDNVLAFVEKLAPRIRHVHANGSRAARHPDGEGTPFDDSDYDLAFVRDVLRRLDDDVVVVPEIMHGHRDGGRGFERGLAALTRA